MGAIRDITLVQTFAGGWPLDKFFTAQGKSIGFKIEAPFAPVPNIY